MYLYLYDSFLNNPKFNNKLAKIETRLTDLGVGGKISRLSPLKNLKELVDDEVKGGVKTIVVVGNDKTLVEVINIIADYKVVLGYIPIGEDNQVAKILGLPAEDKACEIISARKIEKIDLGKINGNYFLGDIKISEGPITLECEEKYQVAVEKPSCQINICNLRPAFLTTNNYSPAYFNPQDGLLEALIVVTNPTKKIFSFFSKKIGRDTIFPFKKISVKSKKSIPVVADNQKILKTPVDIEIVPKKIKVIVGRERMF